MEVNAVTTEHALFPEVAKLRVVNGTRRAAVKHRVPACLRGISGLDDDVAAEIGDLAAHVAFDDVRVRERRIEREGVAVHCFKRALLGLGEIARVLAEGLLVGMLALSCGAHDDELVTRAPAGRCFREREGGVARLRLLAKFEPGVIERSAMELHAPAAIDQRRARVFVHAVKGDETDRRSVCGLHRLIIRPH